MELRHILEILLRRKWIILAAFLSVFLTIVLGTMFVQPWYDAKAKVFLQKSTASSTLLSSLGMQGGNPVSTAYQDTDRADYVALAAIRPVAEKAIEQEHITREKTRAALMRKVPFLKPVFRALGINVEDTTKAMKAEDLIKRSLFSYFFPRPYVKVAQYETTDLIYFEAISTDPEQASKIANAMARAFVENEVMRIRQDYQGAKEYIKNNISFYKNEYAKALFALKEFKEREKTINLDAETADFIQQISDLRKSQKDLQLSLAETRTKYSPSHPAVIDIQNKIEETQKLIQQKMGKVFGSDKEKPDAALQGRANDSPVPPDAGTMTDLPQKSYRYAQLSLAVSVTQDIYNSLLKYSYQVGIAESIAVSNIYFVEEAVTPDRDDGTHKNPKVGLNGMIAAFLGILFGIGAGLFVEYIDDTIKTADDLKALKTITLLGRVARLRKKEPKLIDDVDPRSPLRETYRTIRSSIRYATLDKPMKTILVTSALMGEGKSTVAANIALASLHEGKKVLLIDGDLRRPMVHKYFGLDNSIGLTNYLVGDVGLESMIRQVGAGGLSVVTTGPIPPDPAKLVESKKMHLLLDSMKNAYDLIIIDSPPVLAAGDAAVLGALADGAIVVIESGQTSRRLFADMIESLKKANIDIVGGILNKVSGREGSYHYYYKYYRK